MTRPHRRWDHYDTLKPEKHPIDIVAESLAEFTRRRRHEREIQIPVGWKKGCEVFCVTCVQPTLAQRELLEPVLATKKAGPCVYCGRLV